MDPQSDVVAWIAASPLAIGRWGEGLEHPVTWAAFAAGVIGTLVGWLVVAPCQLARQGAPVTGGSRRAG